MRRRVCLLTTRCSIPASWFSRRRITGTLLRSVYDRPQATRLYEQAHLSHALHETELAHVISPRFNWGIMESMRLYLHEDVLEDETPEVLGRIVLALMRAELRNAYFLHFYGAMNLLKLFMPEPEAPRAAAA